jgi:hypothetical protein
MKFDLEKSYEVLAQTAKEIAKQYKEEAAPCMEFFRIMNY